MNKSEREEYLKNHPNVFWKDLPEDYSEQDLLEAANQRMRDAFKVEKNWLKQFVPEN